MDEKGSLKAELRPQSRTKKKAPILAPKVLITSNGKKKYKINILYLSNWTFPKPVDVNVNKKFCPEGHLKCYIVDSSVIAVNKN